MTKFTKASIAVAALGGTLLMAAPMAFADTGASGTVAGSAQWQSGEGSMNQSTSGSVGSLSADYYHNYTTTGNYSNSSNTYAANGGLLSSQSNSGYGGSSWTTADDYTSKGGTVTASQSSVLNREGGMQGQVVVALTGTVGFDCGWMNVHAVGAGAYQSQGLIESGTMNQNASANSGKTTAEYINYGSNSGNSTQSSTTYTGGKTVSSSKVYGATTSTTATDYSNPSAGYSANQSMAGEGGQTQIGAAALVNFWMPGGL